MNRRLWILSANADHAQGDGADGLHGGGVFVIYEVAVALQCEIAIFPAEHVALTFL